MKKIQLVAAAITLILSSCTKENQPEITVEIHGALKNIMHKGDLSAKIELKELSSQEHIYALGALTNLKGEVLILDSKPFISSVKYRSLEMDTTFNQSASLLVSSSVASWSALRIPDHVKSTEELEKYVEEQAAQLGIDVEKPFPFRIKGISEFVDWHVIDWLDGDTVHSHKKHVNSGLHGTKYKEELEVLGFYSKHHHRIFTHHTTNMHMHFLSANGYLAGHADDLRLGKGMVLYLPNITADQQQDVDFEKVKPIANLSANLVGIWVTAYQVLEHDTTVMEDVFTINLDEDGTFSSLYKPDNRKTGHWKAGTNSFRLFMEATDVFEIIELTDSTMLTKSRFNANSDILYSFKRRGENQE